MKTFLTTLVVFISTILLAATLARSETLQMGIAVDTVPVTSSFDGTEIVIFGSIETENQPALFRGEYDVVVLVEGAPEDIIIRKKERIGGIWINNKAETFDAAPSFYTILSSRPLDLIANRVVLGPLGLGIDNLGKNIPVEGEKTLVMNPGEFSDALRRLRVEQELFVEAAGSLEKLSPSLFRATLAIPANVPIGEHKVTSYLFRDGQLLATNISSFRIEKVGFERWIYDLAHENGLLYGFLAVFIAMFTGWTANALFRKS